MGLIYILTTTKMLNPNLPQMVSPEPLYINVLLFMHL